MKRQRHEMASGDLKLRFADGKYQFAVSGDLQKLIMDAGGQIEVVSGLINEEHQGVRLVEMAMRFEVVELQASPDLEVSGAIPEGDLQEGLADG